MHSFGRFFLTCAGAALLTATATAQSRPPAREVSSPDVRPPAADVAGALQRKYDSVKDFSASFTQTYEGGVLRSKARKRHGVREKTGQDAVGLHRPRRKSCSSPMARRMFLYFPDEKQVMKNVVPARIRRRAPCCS